MEIPKVSPHDFGDRVRDSAMIPAESLNKFSFFWGMSQYKPLNAI
jgi:hypothetical protein